MHLDDPMHDGYISVVQVEHHYLSNPDWLVTHVQKQNVSSVEAWFHAATQNYYNLAMGM